MYTQTAFPKCKGVFIAVAVVIILLLSFCVLVCARVYLPDINAYEIQVGFALAMFIAFYCIFGKRLTVYEYTITDSEVTAAVQKKSVIFPTKTLITIKKEDIAAIEQAKGGKRYYPMGIAPVKIELKNGKKYLLGLDKQGLNYLNAKCYTDAYIDNNFSEMKDFLREIICIPSVEDTPCENMPFGKACADVLDTVLKKCASIGMRTENLDNYCGWAEVGDGERLIAVLCHLDVVPAGDNWDTAPFEAVEKNNRIYGRGSSDDKGPSVAAIYALKAVTEEIGELGCRVRIIFGCNEESDWKCMDRYRQTEETPIMAFTPDAAFPVTNIEKGIAHFSLSTSLNEGEYQLYLGGGMRANMVPSSARATVIGSMAKLFVKLNEYDVHSHGLSFSVKDDVLTIEAEGVSSHGSTPDAGKNAFFELFKMLEYLDLGGSQGEFVKNMLDLFVDKTDGSGINLKLNDGLSGSLTVNMGMCYVGKNELFPDMNDDTCRIIIDIRYPVTYTLQDISALLQSAIPHSWDYEVTHNHQPQNVPADSPLVKALTEVYTEYTDFDPTPMAIGGGTYARAFPGKAVAFGMLVPGSASIAHEANEYLELSDLRLGAKIYAAAIKKLISRH